MVVAPVLRTGRKCQAPVWSLSANSSHELTFINPVRFIHFPIRSSLLPAPDKECLGFGRYERVDGLLVKIREGEDVELEGGEVVEV